MESRFDNFVEFASKLDVYGPLGVGKFQIYPYHEELFEAVDNNDRVIITKFRQGGFTTFNLAYAAWLAKQGKSVCFIVPQVRQIYSYYCQLKKMLNKRSEEFLQRSSYLLADMGEGKILFSSIENLRNIFDQDLFFVEELAFWQDNLAADGMKIVENTNAKFVVTSTFKPNTYFSNLWNYSNFKTFAPSYKEHPSYSDPSWEENMRKTIGEKAWYEEMLGVEYIEAWHENKDDLVKNNDKLETYIFDERTPDKHCWKSFDSVLTDLASRESDCCVGKGKVDLRITAEQSRELTKKHQLDVIYESIGRAASQGLSQIIFSDKLTYETYNRLKEDGYNVEGILPSWMDTSGTKNYLKDCNNYIITW